MNTALLAKWLVRFKDANIFGKWKDILSAKYSSTSHKLSPFWKAIHKDRDLVELGFNKILGLGVSVLFWSDR
jgi:hypothetical protein